MMVKGILAIIRSLLTMRKSRPHNQSLCLLIHLRMRSYALYKGNRGTRFGVSADRELSIRPNVQSIIGQFFTLVR